MGDPTQSPLNQTIQTSQSARTEDKAFCIYCTVYNVKFAIGDQIL